MHCNNDYNAVYYTAEGISLITRKRRKHLAAEDIEKNNKFIQSLAMGSLTAKEFMSLQRRKSLPPPRKMATT